MNLKPKDQHSRTTTTTPPQRFEFCQLPCVYLLNAWCAVCVFLVDCCYCGFILLCACLALVSLSFSSTHRCPPPDLFFLLHQTGQQHCNFHWCVPTLCWCLTCEQSCEGGRSACASAVCVSFCFSLVCCLCYVLLLGCVCTWSFPLPFANPACPFPPPPPLFFCFAFCLSPICLAFFLHVLAPLPLPLAACRLPPSSPSHSALPPPPDSMLALAPPPTLPPNPLKQMPRSSNQRLLFCNRHLRGSR